jgi:hypothetical protein
MRSINEIAGPAANPLKLALVSFLSMLTGFAILFFGDCESNKFLSFIASGIVSISIVSGNIAVLWGWFAFYQQHHKK